MENIDKLLQLYKGLDKHEKRHFSLISKKTTSKKEPNFIRLYKIIDDIKGDKKELAKTHELQSSRKNKELYDKLLESLVIFHTQKDPINKFINQIPHLYEKGQIAEIKKRMPKIKNSALDKQDYEALLTLCNWSLKAERAQPNNKTESTILALQKERQAYLHQIYVKTNLSDIQTELNFILKEDVYIRNPKNKLRYDELIQHQVLQSPPEENHIDNCKTYHYIKSIEYKLSGNLDLSYEHATQLIKLIEENDDIDIEHQKYKKALCNFLIICETGERLDEIPEILQKLKNLKKTAHFESIDNTYYFFGLRYYISKHNFEEATNLVKQIEENWEALCKVVKPKRVLAYQFNILSLFFLNGENNEAYRWLALLINSYNKMDHKSKNIVYAARILEMPILYDQEAKHIENQISSTKKSLKAQDHLGDFESLVLKHFTLLEKCPPYTKQKKEILKQLFKALKELENSNTPIPALDELLLWTQAKIENRSIKEILLNKELNL